MPGIEGRRITIFTGHFGSGKTEIAVNYTLNLKDDHRSIALVDLDYVNPYFRSRETKAYLNSLDITVIASAAECFNTDLPALAPEIGLVLGNQRYKVVVDLGGDETGARAMGRFRDKVADDQYELLFVVNPFRPFTSTAEEVEVIAREVEASSRMQVSALVSNPHMLTETVVDDIIRGHATVLKAARLLQVPVAMISVENKFAELPEIKGLGLPVLRLTRQMTAPWEGP